VPISGKFRRGEKAIPRGSSGVRRSSASTASDDKGNPSYAENWSRGWKDSEEKRFSHVKGNGPESENIGLLYKRRGDDSTKSSRLLKKEKRERIHILLRERLKT